MAMNPYSLADIVRITGGNLKNTGIPEDYKVNQIATDSRVLLNAPNTVFFALRGLRNDGHRFVEELAAKGVRIFVVNSGNSISPNDGCALIEVDDTLKALQNLAAFHRGSFGLPVIGITGSNGKTIVKEWLHDLLSDHFSIIRSPKSYNSQIGVPLSVWHIQQHHTLGIFEAGISLPGEMEKLGKMILPVIGIFTNIGDAHQENFTSYPQKIKEKLLLFKGCRKLVFCIDHTDLSKEVKPFCSEKGIIPLGWSLRDPETPIYFRMDKSDGQTRIGTILDGTCHSFTIPFTDPSSIENACHSFVAALALEIPVEWITQKFLQLAPLSMRLELKKGMNNCVLLNDYYNSDINSLEIALSVLVQQAASNHLEKIVILSDIRQSGYPGKVLYRQVNNLLENAGVDKVIGIGGNISEAGNLFSMKKQFFNSTGEFIANHHKINFSQAAILIKGARDFLFEDISAVLQLKSHQTMLEINLNALVHNLNVFRSLLSPETKIMVMVKAFSYGSGDVEIAKALQLQRVDYLAVAVTDEGKELRQAGITVPVIVMSPEPHSFQQMIDYQLEPNLYSVQLAEEFSRIVAINALDQFPVHLKIDTGMNRLGLKTEEEIMQIMQLLKANPHLKVRSLFSHLAASDDPTFDNFTNGQIIRFGILSSMVIASLEYPVMRHMLNSAGIERFPEYQYEMVRLGIGLYGISSTQLALMPVSRLRSLVTQIKMVGPEETVGYNRSGKVEKPSTIAIVPAGYADGLDRRLGNNNGKVYINGKIASIVGNICMDMCMINVTGIPCKPGDEAEFFGENIPVQEVAGIVGTIPYEILTGISQRVKRIYTQE
jgi:Alr-MurF fusion protein